jgi:hypothetical protein
MMACEFQVSTCDYEGRHLQNYFRQQKREGSGQYIWRRRAKRKVTTNGQRKEETSVNRKAT